MTTTKQQPAECVANAIKNCISLKKGTLALTAEQLDDRLREEFKLKEGRGMSVRQALQFCKSRGWLHSTEGLASPTFSVLRTKIYAGWNRDFMPPFVASRYLARKDKKRFTHIKGERVLNIMPDALAPGKSHAIVIMRVDEKKGVEIMDSSFPAISYWIRPDQFFCIKEIWHLTL